MSQIEKTSQPKKLFRYAIDRHLKLDRKENISFIRVDRWRFNTFNRVNLLKVLKLKGPITFGILASIAVDYTVGFYDNPAAH